jgi:hypothetical protein
VGTGKRRQRKPRGAKPVSPAQELEAWLLEPGTRDLRLTGGRTHGAALEDGRPVRRFALGLLILRERFRRRSQ